MGPWARTSARSEQPCRNTRYPPPATLPVPTLRPPSSLHPDPYSAPRQALEAELRHHQNVCTDLVRRGCDLSARGPPTRPDPRKRAKALQGTWQWLRAGAARRGARLQAALLARQVAVRWAASGGGCVRGVQCTACPPPPHPPQYLADAAEAASWLREQQSALESAPCGPDPEATEALLLHHRRLERAVQAFGAELRQLDEQARAAAAQVSLTVRGAGRAPELRASGSKCTRDLSEAPVSRDHTEDGDGRAFVAVDQEAWASPGLVGAEGVVRGTGHPSAATSCLLPSPVRGIPSAHPGRSSSASGFAHFAHQFPGINQVPAGMPPLHFYHPRDNL